MLQSEGGRNILRMRPRISSRSLQLDRLRALPDGTFGRAHLEFYTQNGITPDSRAPVAYIRDEELAYVMQRYREVHDCMHTLCGIEVSVVAEIGLKWLEFRHTHLPVTVLSVLGSTVLVGRRDRDHLRRLLGWAEANAKTSKFFMSVCFEEMLHMNLAQVRERMGIIPFSEWSHRAD